MLLQTTQYCLVSFRWLALLLTDDVLLARLSCQVDSFLVPTVAASH